MNDDFDDTLLDESAPELTLGGDGAATAVPAWEGLADAACCVSVAEPDWAERIYQSIADSPGAPLVWAQSAPDPAWSSVNDIVNQPDTAVLSADNAIIGPGFQPSEGVLFPDMTITPAPATNADPDLTIVPGNPQSDSVLFPADPQEAAQPAGNPLFNDGTPFNTVVDSDRSGNLVDNLLALYAVAERNGDKRSMDNIEKMLDSYNAAISTWVQ